MRQLTWMVTLGFTLATGCVGVVEEGVEVTEDEEPEVVEPKLSVGATTLLGVHFAGDPEEGDLDVMLAGQRGFTVEMVYAEDPTWVPTQAERLRQLAARGLTVILRVDYARGQNIPPAGHEEAFIGYLRDLLIPELGDAVDLFVLGNEPNLDIECVQSGGRCDPAHYAEVYRRVRRELSASFPERDDTWLIGGVSPGGVEGIRYVSGLDYYRGVLDALEPSEVDGIAIHGYGGGDEEGSLRMFTGDVASQLDLFRELGHGREPVFITEMNRQTTGGDEDEAITARFLRRAYAWIDEHNRSGEQDIIGACWFVYAADEAWRTYSLRSLKSGPDDAPWLADSDVWHAMRAAAQEGYLPGVVPVGDSTEPEPEPEPEGRCDPPHTVEVDGRCVPSCGRAGGDTCGGWGSGVCEGFALLESWDCDVCCRREGVEPDPEPEPSGDCACRAGVDNYCLYGARVEGCEMTWPGGYCDPNGDGDYGDADWGRGWRQYQERCGDGEPEEEPEPAGCGCRADADNYCLYGSRVEGCEMTWPGGYCDPNGDGDFGDADWGRGWYEYQDRCR